MGAVFLDRDGVICQHRRGYVRAWDQFDFIPGELEEEVFKYGMDLTDSWVLGDNVTGIEMGQKAGVKQNG